MQDCYFPSHKKQEKNPLITSKTQRLDQSRTNEEIRPIFLKCGSMKNATGSAYLELGNTKVICSLFGPQNDTRASRREISEKGKLVCDVRYAPFACKERRERRQDSDELEMSSILEQALSPAIMLEKLPKCVLSLFVVILESDGGELGAAITCASLALADGHVEMYDMVAACSAGSLNGRILLDPSCEEEQVGDAQLVVSYMPSLGKVTHILQNGKMKYEDVQEATELCTDGSSGVMYNMIRACLLSNANSI